MEHFDGDALVREYLHRHPEAEHAALYDAEYVAQVHRLREVLDHLGPAMTAEGVPEGIRQRVGARLVAGLLGTDEANARLRERARLAKLLATGTPGT
ncbi:hypothetical protein VSR01_17190 [Actinacidiphila sp. DG2A-62]|uniref:hypothetical protein n=1 Tax=Actinacidiphila sp. DG2A-62 TaxID=3108821 RepID=UPI002DBD8463|nr:hypothetical protein [Actinacidiphila sp. DG2A-62]MEC3995174.1 hypothetical protein [Actinacidiphila sp. DG2A-62]